MSEQHDFAVNTAQFYGSKSGTVFPKRSDFRAIHSAACRFAVFRSAPSLEGF